MEGTSTRPADEMVQNRLYEALAHPYRRSVLQALSTTPLTIDELTSQVVRDSDADDEDEGRTRVLTSLYHVHLPKLADADLVEWDGHSASISKHIGKTSLSVDVNSSGFDINMNVR